MKKKENWRGGERGQANKKSKKATALATGGPYTNKKQQKIIPQITLPQLITSVNERHPINALTPTQPHTILTRRCIYSTVYNGKRPQQELFVIVRECVVCCVRRARAYGPQAATLRYGGYDSKTGAKRQPAGVRAVTLQDRYCPPPTDRPAVTRRTNQRKGGDERGDGGRDHTPHTGAVYLLAPQV